MGDKQYARNLHEHGIAVCWFRNKCSRNQCKLDRIERQHNVLLPDRCPELWWNTARWYSELYDWCCITDSNDNFRDFCNFNFGNHERNGEPEWRRNNCMV